MLAFAFCYLASHYGLDLMTEREVNDVMEFAEGHRDELHQRVEGEDGGSHKREGASRSSDIGKLSKEIAGNVLAEITQPSDETLVAAFKDGSRLIIRSTEKLVVELKRDRGGSERTRSGKEPTHRQREYLEFIIRYMARYGVSPAETDISDHFMVSAPSAHQMLKTLERRGFIARGRDWSGHVAPRSIRVLWAPSDPAR